ncbi:hypothetical protein [Pectobacterium brasiliense]|uniref:hypothetical protein n=1 Tax=Pectobacterium brasiliense TaxID=180957 RepID=UPI0019694CEA|nr:hypothetical protein [Pectobacterium brasiliense]MBN3057713.1 hypothetical protein [Pectobacterium brasiliense]
MTTINTAAAENSITVFRDLIASLPIQHLNNTQRDDLSAIATESVEGLCHGLQYASESLATETTTENLQQLSAYFNACAHLIPALLVISEKAQNLHISHQQATVLSVE